MHSTPFGLWNDKIVLLYTNYSFQSFMPREIQHLTQSLSSELIIW
jgi:hypothetical protein